MKRQPWIEHVFQFGQEIGWSENLVARLKGTEPRLRNLCQNLEENDLELKPNGRWSIKQHIGHLIDLETLFIDRLLQLKQRVEELQAADMSNAKTEATDYQSMAVADILQAFSDQRKLFIRTFRGLNNEELSYSAYHRRLDVRMSPVDVLYFAAEHDDHHIASILEILDGPEK